MCDAAVATAPHTLSGRVVFAKNSDRKLGECQPFLQFPATHHPPGAQLRCTHVSIPQVRETHRIMGHAPWWVWGFEHGVNEHGVVVGNLAVFSKQPPEETPGLIGMDLVRLGLERASTAHGAILVISELLAEHGQGGAALAPDGSGYHNSFLLADPREAWILETTGRSWAARPAKLDALTNHLCLAADWSESSRDLDVLARAEGWWKQAGKLDVAAAYRNEHVPGRISEPRQNRALELLRSSNEHDAHSMQRLLRDHGEGGPAPCVGANLEQERYFTLCMHSEPVGTTTASLVAEIPADAAGVWPVWISFATPCTGIFLPTYIDGVIPHALARQDEGPGEESAWRSFDALQTAAAADFAKHNPMLREAWAPLEDRIEVERTLVEAAATEAKQRGDLDECAAVLSAFMDRTANEALALARELRSAIA